MQHRRCALVTGVQTCALPIFGDMLLRRATYPMRRTPRCPVVANGCSTPAAVRIKCLLVFHACKPCIPAKLRTVVALQSKHDNERSEESRVGKEGVSKSRSRW